MSSQSEDPSGPLQAISNEMVRIYKRQLGRGPKSVRTVWSGPDALTVFLEETFTPAENNLVRMGEHQRMRDTRLFFQYALVPELCEPVERITGRTVRSLISGVDTATDISIETFVLYGRGEYGPSRATINADM